MKKTLTTITLSVLTLFIPTVSVAQKAHRLMKPSPVQTERQPKGLVPSGKSIVHKVSTGTPKSLDPSVVLWTNANINEQWGYYSFHPKNTADKISFTLLGKQTQRIAKNGVQIADGKMYTVDFQRYGVGSGDLTLYTYDLLTWQGSGTTYNDFSLAALETAQAKDGTVYGEFYNSTANNQQFELGTVDYRTRKRTTFGTTTRKYVAMGITSDNRLYGIASDGFLYKISITDGAETKIGSTGIELTDESGVTYLQTGEIDPKDNTFYWYAQDKDYNTALYTVDLNTGAVTKIADANITMYGMAIAPVALNANAPASVSQLAVAFSGTDLNGTVSFTLPTKTVGGANLNGNVDYVITANGTQIATGTAQPGASISKPVQLLHSDEYNFVVTVSNSGGTSPASNIKQWIGFDEPEVVGNPTATLANGIVTISWTAPTAGVHQGTLGNLTYDVIRIQGRDTISVAAGISGTSCTDDLSTVQQASYTYAVRAISGDVKGSRWRNTTSLVAGVTIEPDWSYRFEGQSALSMFKVIDANNDKFTWWCNGVLGYGAMSYQAHATIASDDWLVTPAIHLSSDRVYTVSFKVRNIMKAPQNTLEVKWGKGNNPEQLTNTLINTFTPEFSETNGEWQVCTADIIPDTNGNFYIGFHDNTCTTDKYQIAIDNISITKTAYSSAPDSVKSLIVTPAQNGALKATIRFTTPNVSLNGAALSRIDSFTISRDGMQIGRINASAIGAQVEWTDENVPTSGFHTYTITPYLDGHPGRKATSKAYIGIDVPHNPTGIMFTDQGKELKAVWDRFKSTGANGGFLNPEGVSVTFYTLEKGDFGFELGDSLTTSTLGATSATIPFDPNKTTMEDGKTQTLAWFAVRANSDGGQSEYITARGVVVGPSIPLPFKESMKGGQLDNGFASLLGNEQYNSRKTAAAWRVVTDAASDKDGGSFVWANYTEVYAGNDVEFTIQQGDETSVNMPKVALAGAANPKLFFDLYSLIGNEATLKVLVQTPDGKDHVAAQYDLSRTAKNGWERQTIDLGAYSNERYIIVKFDGVAKGSKVMIGVDNINILDQFERNLAAISITTPESVIAGKKGQVKVVVKNLGAVTAERYFALLYINGNQCDAASRIKQLPSMASDTITMKLPVAINEGATSLQVKAMVVYDGDMQLSDNETEAKSVKVIPSPYGKINDLKAQVVADNKVVLTWGLPTLPEPKRIMDGFESYSPFAKDMTPWTMVDGDKSMAGALQPSSTFPGQGEPFAFTAFNPNWWIEDMTNVNPGLAPHNGNQYAAAVYGYDSNRKFVAQNNWLISPRLSGRKQEVTFYVLNIATRPGDTNFAENFDILYSTEGTDTANFVKIKSEKANGTTAYNEDANWKQITVEIPEGAKYFAIHHNTPKGKSYIFGVDDVSYEQLSTGADDKITEYIIYRDGKKIASVKGDQKTYTNTRVTGDHVYNVTVVYTSKDGEVNESGFSNDASTNATSIEVVEDTSSSYDITTINGVRVRTGAKDQSGLKRGVYIINGKKRVIK
jgi:cleaved adhesin domain protein